MFTMNYNRTTIKKNVIWKKKKKANVHLHLDGTEFKKLLVLCHPEYKPPQHFYQQ